MKTDGDVVIEISANTKSFEMQIANVEEELEGLVEEFELIKKDDAFPNKEKELLKYGEKIEKTKNKLGKLKEQQAELDKQNLPNVLNHLNGIGSSTENIIRKVAKWGLALFSIRSAYSFIRSSVSTLSQTNEQIGTDIEYIRWVLATTLQPVIEGIIKLVFTLLQYINYIANAWFGVNIFANQSADAFKKTKDNVKGTNTEAKKLQKTLAGFDEMNILQEDGSVSKGGGGGGVALPTTDLSKMLGEVEIPGWVDLIARNKDTIVNALLDIVKTFALFKILEWLIPALGMFGEGVSKLGMVLQSVGIVLLIVGIWNAMTDLLNLIANPSWENFNKLISDLSLALSGLGLILIGLNASNPFGWITLAIGAIGLLIGSLIDLSPHEQNEEELINRQKTATDALKEAREKLTSTFGEFTNAIKAQEQAEKDLAQAEKETGLKGEQLYKQVLNNRDAYKKFTPEQRKVYDAYVKNQEAIKRVEKASQEITETRKKELGNIASINASNIKLGQSYDETFEKMMNGLETGETSWEDFTYVVSTMLAQMDKETATTFISNLPYSIEKGLADVSKTNDEWVSNIVGSILKVTTSYEEVEVDMRKMEYTYEEVNVDMRKENERTVNSFKNWFNPLDTIKTKMDKIQSKKVTIDVNTIVSGTTSAVNVIKKAFGFAKGGLVTKLASGGIINRPGRGVPISSAIGGEAGREGIIPLTDSQAMETLGQAIGKYININATVPVYVGNRQVARELKKIEAEDNFAFNN